MAQSSALQSGARARDVWRRLYPIWDAYFAIAMVVTIVIVALDAVHPVGAAITSGLLVALGVAYLWVGRRAIRRHDTTATVLYVAAMVLLFVPATLLIPAAAFGLCALTPQAYLALRPALATVLTTVLLSGVAYRWITHTEADPLFAILVLVLILGCSLLLGLFIDRQSRQNVERARLIAELDQTRDELAGMSRQAGMLAERERLARDIHDTVAQGLGGISMLLQAAEAETGPNRHLRLARDAARDNLAEVRALVAALAPPSLENARAEHALVAALDRLTFESDTAEFTVIGVPRSLDPSQDAVLLRVAQEAFSNAVRHADAGSIRLELSYGEEDVALTVADDGIGFTTDEAATVRPDLTGFGLSSMRGRVEQAGGRFAVTSAAGAGTTVVAELPCPI